MYIQCKNIKCVHHNNDDDSCNLNFIYITVNGECNERVDENDTEYYD